jgi:hypothetical protein
VEVLDIECLPHRLLRFGPRFADLYLGYSAAR